jgi:hypothetical protein
MTTGYIDAYALACAIALDLKRLEGPDERGKTIADALKGVGEAEAVSCLNWLIMGDPTIADLIRPARRLAVLVRDQGRAVSSQSSA